jgi:hypothetical protein
MKERCEFIGREIMDIIEDVDKIEDRLIFGEQWGVSIPTINLSLETVVRDTKDLVDHDLMEESHCRKVEAAVQDLNGKLPMVTDDFQRLLITAPEVLIAIDHIKNLLTDTLLETVIECESKKVA